MEQEMYYVAIVDDQEIYRYVAKHKISEVRNFAVVLDASNGQDLIDKLELSAIMPHICILDLSMPVMDGYETIKILNKKWPAIKTLVISQYCQKYAIEQMIALGARGFMSKEEMLSDLGLALTSVINNGYYCSSLVGQDMFNKAEKSELKTVKLTSVEKQILSLLCKDIQYDEIARMLFKSKFTIEKHKQNISRKIGINSREGLILFAIKNEFGFLS